jgi:membrane protein required for colicin V production
MLEDNTCALIAFAITFIGVIFGVRLVAKAIEKILNVAMLGFVNKIAGAAFGALKFAFILSVILYFYHRIDPRMTIIPFDARENSILYSPVQSMAPFIIPKLEAEKDKYNLQRKQKKEEKKNNPEPNQNNE